MSTCSKCLHYYLETLTGRLWCWVFRRRQEYDIKECFWFTTKELISNQDPKTVNPLAREMSR